MADDTRVWWSSTGSFVEDLLTWLDPGEQRRARRFRHEPARQEFVVAAVLARVAVAAASGADAAEVALDRTCPDCDEPHGRPSAPGSGVHLSIAHSAGTVVVATSCLAPVGVDVEQVRDLDDGVRSMVLAPGEHVPDRTGLTWCWTRKEAVLKATGDGLRVPMAAVRLSGTSGGTTRVLSYDGLDRPPWCIVDLSAPAGFAAALGRLAESVPAPRHTVGRLADRPAGRPVGQ